MLGETDDCPGAPLGETAGAACCGALGPAGKVGGGLDDADRLSVCSPPASCSGRTAASLTRISMNTTKRFVDSSKYFVAANSEAFELASCRPSSCAA